MRVQFQPQSEAYWKAHFAQRGAGLTPFYGVPYQRGGAGFGAIFRGLLRAVMPLAKSAGKAIGRQALRTGRDIAGDLLEGGDPRQTIETHVRKGGAKLIRRVGRRAKQTGRGLGKRPTKSINTTGRIRKRQPKRGARRDVLGAY